MSEAPELLDESDYLSDSPLDPQPQYPQLRETFETAIIITNLPKVRVVPRFACLENENTLLFLENKSRIHSSSCMISKSQIPRV